MLPQFCLSLLLQLGLLGLHTQILCVSCVQNPKPYKPYTLKPYIMLPQFCLSLLLQLGLLRLHTQNPVSQLRTKP